MPTVLMADTSITNQTFYGTEEGETIWGRGVSDRIFGLGGNDTINAEGLFLQSEFLRTSGYFADGGAGNDWLQGTSFADTLIGGMGVDAIWAQGGDDLLVGSQNGGWFRGHGGEDTLQIPFSTSDFDLLNLDSNFQNIAFFLKSNTNVRYLTESIEMFEFLDWSGSFEELQEKIRYGDQASISASITEDNTPPNYLTGFKYNGEADVYLVSTGFSATTGAGNDRVEFTDFRDETYPAASIRTNGGDDIIIISVESSEARSLNVFGDSGFDKVKLSNSASEYSVSTEAGFRSYLVSSSAGMTLKLFSIEYLEFLDQTINLSTGAVISSTLSSLELSIDEGGSALFKLETSGFLSGTLVTYTLSGISESDLESGSLTGTTVVSDSGTTIISLPLAADALTEGVETLTITLDEFAEKTASVIINDISKAPTYSITSGSDSYDEGQSAFFSLVTTNLAAGAAVAYTLSGISESDLESGLLTGMALVSVTGTTIISLPLAADALTEGAETLTITLDDSSSTTASVIINDTSKNPVIVTTNHTTSILVDKDVLGASPVILQGLTENIEETDGVTTSHVFSYNGSDYDYDDISPFIIIVVRDDEFTDDFRSELADFAPEFKDISYQEAVDAVGLIGISAAIITVAGADGNYIV